MSAMSIASRHNQHPEQAGFSGCVRPHEQVHVFVELKPGHFKRTIIHRGTTRGKKIAISGIAEGTPVVTEGAFYLGAELAKSGFAQSD